MLLDTSIVVDILRGTPAAKAFLQTLGTPPALSTMTVAEIHAGVTSQRAELIVQQFFRDCVLYSVSPAIAEVAGNLMRHYRASHDLDIVDVVIGATAEHHGLPLATLNVKHFPMFKRLRAPY